MARRPPIPVWLPFVVAGALAIVLGGVVVTGMLLLSRTSQGDPPPAGGIEHPNNVPAESPAVVARKYAVARTAAERLPLIHDRGRVEPLATAEWAKHRIRHAEPIEESRVVMLGENAAKVTTQVRQGEATGDVIHYVRKSKDGWKIDWEASAGHNQYSLRAVKGSVQSGKHTMRVYVRISSLYLGNWHLAANSAYAFEIEDSQPNEGAIPARIYGYIWRTDPVGVALFSLCQDGNRHQVTLEMEYDFATPDVIAIRGLASSTWLAP